MANVSYDGQSFSVDGRRLWLAAGSIDFTRTTRGDWPRLVRQARDAGLNAVATRVFWHDHESRPGLFDFTGDRDLRAFVELLADHGLWCVLRPGPSHAVGRDAGGLPPHVHRARTDKRSGPMKVRSASPPFLEGVSRFFGAVMDQVRDLQVTTPLPGKAPRPSAANPPGRPAGGFQGQSAGPILLMQVEHRWTAASTTHHDGYLRQLVRFLQENGAAVPLLSATNFWQPIDGTIAAWNGRDDLPAHLRQLGVVQPEAPRLAIETEVGAPITVGHAPEPPETPDALLRRLAGVLAAGAQCNLDPFHPGSNYGYTAGRRVDGPDAFACSASTVGAPLAESGAPTERLGPVRRVATFASQFATLLASLEPAPGHVAVSPQPDAGELSVVHQTGNAGDLVVLLRGDKHKPADKQVRVLLPEGLELDVPLGKDRAAWLVLNANLGGAATLDYTNLRPLAFVDQRLLVLYGPPGADGVVCVDGAPIHIPVPAGKTPQVETHEGLTVVVMSPAQADRFALGPDGLYIGADTLDDAGKPRLGGGAGGSVTRVGLDGKTKSLRVAASTAPPPVKFTGWAYADLDAFTLGDAEAYEPLKKHQPLELIGDPGLAGYAWLRFRVGKSTTGKLVAPGGGDRLHLFAEGRRKALLGVGPGATDGPVDASLPSGETVVLVDALGRYDDGADQGEDVKGLPHGLCPAKPIRLAKPKPAPTRQPDPFALPGYHPLAREGAVGPAEALAWSVKPASRKPVLLRIVGLADRCVVRVNDTPVAYYGGLASGRRLELVLDPADDGPTTGGTNTVELAFFGPAPPVAEAVAAVAMLQLGAPVHDAKAGLAHAPFTPPDDAFGPAPKTLPDAPAWWACDFDTPADDTPAHVALAGMTKGVVVLNGRVLGRYWVADPAGKAVGPQTRLRLPGSWLRNDGEPNRLLLFDENGKRPSRVKLVFTHDDPV